MRNPFSFMRTSSQSRAAQQAAAEDQRRSRRSVAEAIKDALGHDALDKAASPSTQMSVALGLKPVYGGTVSKATIARRRAANKRARQARAMHRRAAR